VQARQRDEFIAGLQAFGFGARRGTARDARQQRACHQPWRAQYSGESDGLFRQSLAALAIPAVDERIDQRTEQ
jgi:hypothetical protein